MPDHAVVDTSIMKEFHRLCSKNYIQSVICTEGKTLVLGAGFATHYSESCIICLVA